MRSLRVLVLGDSIALGLGATGEPFSALLQRDLSAEFRVELWNASINGANSLTHLARLADYVAFQPDVVLFHVGSIDALQAPRRDRSVDLVGWLPRRYQQPGWLQPRPYLPSRWWKRVLYAIPESYVRVRVGRVLMRVLGGVHYVDPEPFRDACRQILQALRASGSSCVVCGLGPVDHELFPGTAESYPRYRQILRELAAEAGCRFVDLDAIFASARHHRQGLLLLDNFHPSAEGHRAIARALLPTVRAALAERASA